MDNERHVDPVMICGVLIVVLVVVGAIVSVAYVVASVNFVIHSTSADYDPRTGYPYLDPFGIPWASKPGIYDTGG